MTVDEWLMSEKLPTLIGSLNFTEPDLKENLGLNLFMTERAPIYEKGFPELVAKRSG